VVTKDRFSVSPAGEITEQMLKELAKKQEAYAGVNA